MSGPEGVPDPLRIEALLLVLEGGGIRWNKSCECGIGPGWIRAVVSKWSASIRMSPKAIPDPLSSIELKGGIGYRRVSAKPDAQIDMGKWPKFLKHLLQSRILLQCLDEAPHAVECGGVHLRDELSIAIRREAFVDPPLVYGKIELGQADQEGVGTEAVEWSQPTPGLLEVPGE
jgi:hypothetical protein